MSDISASEIALVTGGNRGIGLAIANELRSSGFTVIAASRSGESVEGHFAVAMDVTSTESVDSAFAAIEAEHGLATIIVCNAGITRDGLVMRMSDEDFTDVVDTNLTGSFRVARRATKGMLKAKRGRLIFIGSVVGSIGSGGQVNYSATKAGVIGMARSFARELGSRGITSNVVAPGFVETDMTAVLTDARRQEISAAIPLERFAAPSEVGKAVAFLASDSASYITGAVIPVDGGLGMGH